MIFNLFRKSPQSDAAYAVYEAIVAQSRQPVFYAEWDVPDSVTGRFDMISLHLSLLLKRLNREPDGRPLGQAVVDLFFRDMDRSLREMGVGDLSVPKKIKKMGNLFYGLATVLDTAVDSGQRAVEDVVVKNLFDGKPAAGAAPLARYLLTCFATYGATPLAAIAHGDFGTAVAA